jgi:hypothetical protein
MKAQCNTPENVDDNKTEKNQKTGVTAKHIAHHHPCRDHLPSPLRTLDLKPAQSQ